VGRRICVSYRLKTHSYVLANVKFDTATSSLQGIHKNYLPVEDTKELYWQIKENIIMKLVLGNAIFY
jgi:hypothetical protein